MTDSLNILSQLPAISRIYYGDHVEAPNKHCYNHGHGARQEMISVNTDVVVQTGITDPRTGQPRYITLEHDSPILPVYRLLRKMGEKYEYSNKHFMDCLSIRYDRNISTICN